MSRIVYDNEQIKLIALFEKITNARVKDLFVLNQPVFIVEEGDMGKALGRKKSNLFKIESMLNKKIKIVEYSPNMPQFIVNLVFPLKLQDIKEENQIVTLTAEDTKTRGFLIGRNAQNLRNYEKMVQKYFDIKEIKVA